MNRESLKQRIMKVRDRSVSNYSENEAKRYLIEPIFNDLGWDTSDPDEVRVEYYLPPEGRVDYAFLANRTPLIFVEAKAPNTQLEHHTRQLLKYAFAKQDIKLAVLTNGLEWWLYTPMDGAEWEDRKFYTVDLVKQQDVEKICEMLIRFLGKENVLSGEAVSEAKDMRKSTERNAKIKKALPKVWNAIVTKPHDKLINLLMDEVEGDCGFRPDEDRVKEFIQKNKQHFTLTNQPPPPTGEKKARHYGGDRKPNISGPRHNTIGGRTIELLKEGPKTFEELVDVIVKEFPNNRPDTLRDTTKRRLHGQLRRKFGVNIEKDNNGRYFIK